MGCLCLAIVRDGSELFGPPGAIAHRAQAYGGVSSQSARVRAIARGLPLLLCAGPSTRRLACRCMGTEKRFPDGSRGVVGGKHADYVCSDAWGHIGVPSIARRRRGIQLAMRAEDDRASAAAA